MVLVVDALAFGTYPDPIEGAGIAVVFVSILGISVAGEIENFIAQKLIKSKETV